MTKTVMLIDDAVSTRGLLNMTLSNAGYDVVEAGDGKEAMQKLSGKRDIHLFIIDLYMPNMDGMELIKTLKASPQHKFVPIVILTKEDSPEMKRKGQAAGAKAWIVKPFKPKTISDVVKKIIG